MNIPINDGLLQVFDVEHGCCSLLTMPNPGGSAKRLLIDCGHNTSRKWYPGEHLRNLGVTSLEQLVVTNYDEDHVSGLPNLLKQGINVDWILRNPSVTPQTIRMLKTKDGMGPGIDALVGMLSGYGTLATWGKAEPQFAGVQIEWFYNQYPYFEDENNLSLVLHLRVHGFSFLFPGDMECAGFENMLNTNTRFREVVRGLHVLMASHHGRENGICEDMFDKWGCRPKLAVISDGYKQHATQETTQYYGSKCIGVSNFRGTGVSRKVLTTRTDGQLKFTFQGGNCVVS